jgi:predicted MFS family arabinose efflux permease
VTRRPLDVVLVMLNQSFQSLAFGGIALFLPLIRKDVGLTFTQAGALSAASTVVYAFMQIPAGYLADRVGPKRLFAIGLAGTNVLAIALALEHDFTVMLLNQGVSGFFRALVFAPGLLLMTALFSPERRATAMGLYVAAGFSSSIFLNLLGPVLVDPLGWRWLFAIFACGGLVVLAIYLRFGAAGPARSGADVPLRDVLALFRIPVMWLIGGIQYVRLAVAFGISIWLPTMIVDDKGYSLKVAGAVVALGAAMTAPSNFLGGYVSDRLGNPLLVIRVSLIVLATTTVLLVHVDAIVPLIAVIAVQSLFVQLYFGPLFAVPIEFLGPRSAGLTSGFGNFFANVGGFTFAYTLGALKDATGSFAVGLYSLSVMCLIGLACTVALGRMRPAAVAAPETASA